MPLRIKCPTGHVLIVPDNRVGRELRCPRCEQAFVVPAVDKKLSLQSGKVPTAPPPTESLDSAPKPTAPPSPIPAPISTQATTALTTAAPTDSLTNPPAATQPVAATAAPPAEPDPAPATAPEAPPAAARNFPPRKAITKPPAEAPTVEAPTVEAPQPTLAPPAPAPPTPEAAPTPEVTAPKPPAATVPPPPADPAAPAPPPEPDPAAPAASAQLLADITAAMTAAAKQTPRGNVPISIAPRKLPPKTPPKPTAPPSEQSPTTTQPTTVTPSPASEQAVPAPAIPPPPTASPPAPPPQVAPPQTAQVVAPEPPPVASAPTPPTPKQGVIHGWDKRLAVYQLAAAVIAAAIFAMIPGVWDVLEYLSIPDSPFIARWAVLLLTLGIVQLAYGVYLIQLPDWTTVWVITLYCLAMAAVYAMLCGLTLITSVDGTLVKFLQLQDKLNGGQAALWSLCMTSLFTLLAFFAGRMSVRWHRTETLLHSVGYIPR